MADENKIRPQHGETDRDPATGRFACGNACARGRRSRRVDVEVPIPEFLADHAGIKSLWPLWTRLAVEGNQQAVKMLSDLALGLVRPAGVGMSDGDSGAGFEDDGGETVDEDCVEDMREMVERMSPAERNALRGLLQEGRAVEE